MATSSSSVELGFVENRAAWKLKSKFFPSKVGGSPAWMRLDNLPDRSKLLCSTCNQPLVFLMQVYAPIHEIESAFHRTLFVFICTSSKCSEGSNNKNLVVYRNQLPRKNNFYSFQPPEYNEKTASDPSAAKHQTLCRLCSLPASVKCTKCDKKNYCCEDHRAKDWDWNHKVECEGEENQDGTKKKKFTNNFLLPEFELVTETEILPVTAPEKSDAEKMKEFDTFMKSDNAPKEMQDLPIEELDDFAKKKDKAFNKFQKRIKIEPDQVLRYQRGGTPLWVSSENVPTAKDIPNCNCGSKRIFEFQIMPQLLNHVKLDSVQILRDGKEVQSSSIDWGTLVVYTCSKSCRTGTENYAKEFIWKQDFSADTTSTSE